MARKGEVEEAAGATPAAAAAAETLTPMPEAEVEELPQAIVRRVVKDKLSLLAAASSSAKGGGGGEEVTVNKDAIAAFAESARIFIHYLSATANDVCKESKRQTINAEDVLKALEEIDFPEFIEPLRASLQEYRSKNASRKSGASKNKTEKKRKLDEESLPEKEEEGGADRADENDG